MNSIEIIKNMITKDAPVKDAAGVYIPGSEAVNIRNKVLRECLQALHKSEKENTHV